MTLKIFSGGETLLNDMEAEVCRLDALFSTENENSEISRLNAGDLSRIGEDTSSILQSAWGIASLTDGAYDPTVYPLVCAWGFTRDVQRIPEPEEIRLLLKKVGWNKVENGPTSLPQGMAVDLGGIAKGYAADCLVSMLRSRGEKNAMLSLGGSVLALGSRPDGTGWRIALQDPEKIDGYFALLTVRDRHVVTSGNYQRRFEENGVSYGHILDPRTGYPADNGLISVTVICKSGVLADGLSTALFVMGLDAATEFWRSGQAEFEMVLMTDERQVYVTEGLEDALECAGGYEVLRK